jgi:LacI family transcriptional regulator
VQRVLRWLLRSATLPNQGPSRSTLRDVAAEAGVSLSTASRAARGAASVRPEVRRRVLDAIAALGYEPDTAARSMRTGQSRAAGFVVVDIGNPFFAAVCRGVESVLQAHDYSLLLVNSDGDPLREREAVSSLRARRVDGLILSVASERADYLPEVVRSVPAVLVDRELAGMPVDAVRSDHTTGMRAAIEHLVGLGHRRLAMLAASMEQYGTRARVEAFVAATANLGIAPEDAIVRTEVAGMTAARSVVRELLDAKSRPSAVIAASNDLIVASLEVMHDLGLEIPGDISYVSCEDFDVCRIHVPAVAVIRRDLFQLGQRAAELLIDRLHDTGRVEGRMTVELPTIFDPRGSTAPPRVASPPTR